MKRMNMTAVAAAGALLACAAWTFGQDSKPATDVKVAGDAAPQTYRSVAIALPGSEVAFVKKGDHVDVLVTFDCAVPRATPSCRASSIMPIRGLSASNRMSRRSRESSTGRPLIILPSDHLLDGQIV